MSIAIATPEVIAAREDDRPMVWWKLRPALGSETLILLCSVFFSVFSNGSFWHGALAHPLEQWRLALSLFLLVTALHALLLGLVINRWTAKPLLSVLLLVTALATQDRKSVV